MLSVATEILIERENETSLTPNPLIYFSPGALRKHCSCSSFPGPPPPSRLYCVSVGCLAFCSLFKARHKPHLHSHAFPLPSSQ